MSNAYLKNAFKMLDALNEDVFDISDDGISQLADTLNAEDNTVNIIDPEAESEEDIQDSYMGKAILECEVCHSLIYKGKDEIKIDDESQLANIDEECPYCFSTNGYKIVGQVEPFKEESEEDDIDIEVDGDDVEVKVDSDEDEKDNDEEGIDESLKEGVKNSKQYSLKESFNLNDFDRKYKAYTVMGDEPIISWELIDYVEDGDKINIKVDYSVEWDDYEISFILDPDDYDDSEDYWCAVKGSLNLSFKNTENYEDAGFLDLDKVISYNNTIKNISSENNNLTKYLNELDHNALSDFIVNLFLGYFYLTNNKRTDESLKEGFNDVQITTDDQHLTMTQDSETGKVTVETEPIQQEESFEDEEMMIAPLNDEEEQEIEDNSDRLEAEESEGDLEEVPEDETSEESEDEESEDVDISDFEESLFNDLGQKYLTEVYDNIESFNTSNVYQDNKNNKLIIEGVIKFTSGNSKKTSFIFEAKDIDKDRKVRFVGENQQITKGKKSFTLRGTLKDGTLLSESLTYNYRTRDNDGESVRLYNTIKVGK